VDPGDRVALAARRLVAAADDSAPAAVDWPADARRYRRRRRARLVAVTSVLGVAGISLAAGAVAWEPTEPDDGPAGITVDSSASPPPTTGTTGSPTATTAPAAADPGTGGAPGGTTTSTTATGPVETALSLEQQEAVDVYLETHPHLVASPGVLLDDVVTLAIGVPDDPGSAVRVVQLADGGTWIEIGSAGPPAPALPLDGARPIQIGDLTGDGDVDFVVPFLTIDAAPAGVLTGDGGRWRFVAVAHPPPPYGDGGADPPTDGNVYVVRDPVEIVVPEGAPDLARATLVSGLDTCDPWCSMGTVTRYTWTYHRASDHFSVGGPER
jgi:hypothetical protein